MEYSIPRYLKIAVNIAERIASNELPVGGKLKGRSVLSTEYSVSAETIRRAMSLLADKDVVKIANGKENIVLSKEKAVSFIKSFNNDSIIYNLRLNLAKAYEKRVTVDQEINILTDRLINMYRYKRSDIIKPVEIQLPIHSHLIGKSIGGAEFWHNTGATIIGIIRNEDTVVSPGPYFEFLPNDKIIFVGDNNVIERVNAFVNGIKA